MRPRGKKRNNAPSATDQLFYIEQKRCDQEIINDINEIIHELGKKMVFVETMFVHLTTKIRRVQY